MRVGSQVPTTQRSQLQHCPAAQQQVAPSALCTRPRRRGWPQSRLMYRAEQSRALRVLEAREWHLSCQPWHNRACSFPDRCVPLYAGALTDSQAVAPSSISLQTLERNWHTTAPPEPAGYARGALKQGQQRCFASACLDQSSLLALLVHCTTRPWLQTAWLWRRRTLRCSTWSWRPSSRRCLVPGSQALDAHPRAQAAPLWRCAAL
jgi:hypothetical protein